MDPTGKHNGTRSFCVAAALAMVFMGILACVPAAQSKSPQSMQEDMAEDTNGPGKDAGAVVTTEPVAANSPDVTEEPAGTSEIGRASCRERV